jgi:uridine kinase
MTQRERLLTEIAGRILALRSRGVLCVGVDGADGAGKSTFADELGQALAASHRTVIRASVDVFHNPRSVRYRRGRSSPRGFYEDSYDYAMLVDLLLGPLSPGGSRRFRRAAFDHRRDAPISANEENAPEGSILVFDGQFLHREELRNYWQYSIFLDVGLHVVMSRCAERGEGSTDPTAPSNHRYVEGQSIYMRTCNPRELASVVVNNEDLAAPYIVA